MSEGKSLKFQFVLDENSFQRVQRALTQLTKQAQDFAKAMQGTGGSFFGGANVGRPPTAAGTQVQGGPQVQTQIGRVVMDNAQAFKNLSNMGTQSIKGLTDALKRGIDDQKRQVRGLQDSLDALGRTYDRLGSKAGGALGEKIQNRMVQVAGRLNDARAQLGGMERNLPHQELMPEIPWPGQEQGQGPSRWQRLASRVYGPRRSGGGGGGGGGGGEEAPFIEGIAPNSVKGWMKVGGMIAAGVQAVIGESMGGTRTYVRQEERRGAIVNDRIRRLMGGDITDLQAQRFITGEAARDMGKQSGAMAEAEARTGGALKGIGSAITGVFGGAGGGGLLEGQTTAAVQSTMAENSMAQQEAKKNSTDFLMRKMALENFQGNLGSRVSIGRILGTGLSWDKKKERWRDTYNESEAALQASGYDNAQLASALQQGRSLGGDQWGRRNAGMIMRANAAGYGEFGGMAAAASRSGANALGALGGGISTTAGIQLGNALFGFDPRGTVSGTGALKAIQQGMSFSGGIEDMNAVARAGLGMQAGDRMAAGFDPYSQGRNLLTSIGALGPGATTYAQDSLAGRTSFKELLELASGGTSARAEAYGYGGAEARSALEGMGGSIFERFVDQGGTDRVSTTIKAMRESGMSSTDFMASLGEKAKKGDKEARKQLQALGVYASDEMGGDTEGGIGLIEAMSGVKGLESRKLKEGKAPAGGMGDVEKAAQEAISRGTKAIQLELENAAATMKADFGKTTTAAKLMSDFGQNLDASTAKFMESLDNLSKAIDDRAFKMSGGKVGSELTSSITKAKAPVSEQGPKPSPAHRGGI